VSLNNAVKHSLFGAWKVNYSKNINTNNIFNAVHDRRGVQQTLITELMTTMFNVSTVQMNGRQQSYGPVISAERFGAKFFILQRTVPNLSCVKVCAVFSGTPCRKQSESFNLGQGFSCFFLGCL